MSARVGPPWPQTPRRPRQAPALLLAWLCFSIAACGLKAPLELPERSGNVVIRGPGTTGATAAEPGTTAPSLPQGQAPAPAVPGAAPPAPGRKATRPPAAPSSISDEEFDRMPPPELPGGDPGTARGG